jgi:hypothetical protein
VPINAGTWAPPAIVVPAGGRIVRFQVNQCAYQGVAQSGNFNSIPLLNMVQQIHFTAGPYSGRNVWNSTRAIPFTVMPVIISLVANFVGYYNAGDDELSVNQKCSYGGPGKAASTIKFDCDIFADVPGTALVTPTNYVAVNFKVLYEI